MATKRSKGTIEQIVETIAQLVRQPLTDQSNEVPSKARVRRSKAVAAGPRRGKATKAKTKKAVTKKRAPSKRKSTTAKRKKKR